MVVNFINEGSVTDVQGFEAGATYAGMKTYALKNIPNIDLLEEMGTNVYDILKRDKLVLTVKSLKKIEERLK